MVSFLLVIRTTKDSWEREKGKERGEKRGEKSGVWRRKEPGNGEKNFLSAIYKLAWMRKEGQQTKRKGVANNNTIHLTKRGNG